MATAPKPPVIRGITPKGIAAWPHLNKPDEFKGKKSYKVDLTLAGDMSEELRAKIEEASEANRVITVAQLEDTIKNGKTGDAKAKAKKALSALTVGLPFSAAVDDTGEETGEYKFKFKANAEFEDKKTGLMKAITIPLFDAKGQPTKASIWGGSTLRVAYALIPYYVASANQCGISLRIEGIKVINLVSGSGGRGADSLGLGGEEEGYTAEAMDGDESGGSDSSGDEDF